MISRKILLALSLFISAPAISAGIPVFDAVGNIESIKQWIQKLNQWQETATHYKSEIDAYKRQLATATGIRDIQEFLKDAKSLKVDISNLRKNGVSLDDLLINPDGYYSTELQTLYNKYKSFETCNQSSPSKHYLESCKQLVLNQAVMLENTNSIHARINTTLNDISGLSDRIINARDTKESQDLANAIASKSIQLNVLTSQWGMYVKQAKQRTSMLTQQRLKAFNEQQLYAPIPNFNN